MWSVLKKYWDIFGGLVVGILMAVFAKFQLEKIQLFYSIIILVLLSIGFFRMIKQTVNEHRTERHTVIDTMVDGHQAVKAVSMAQNPTKDGEVLGYATIKLWEGLKMIMKKIKELCDKFKGIVLAIALGIVALVEGYGGYINGMCGGVLMVNGVEVLPLVTFVASLIVGIISNSWTKEQKAKINALLKSGTADMVIAEAKKTEKSEAKTSEKKNDLKNL
jgi:hypothetical protein